MFLIFCRAKKYLLCKNECEAKLVDPFDINDINDINYRTEGEFISDVWFL